MRMLSLVQHPELCRIFSIGSIPERKRQSREGRVRTVALCTSYEGLTLRQGGREDGKGFTISRVGHVGIQCTNVDRSITWYRDVLGLTLTGRWPMGENGEMAFMRFTDDHHNIVLFTHPTRVTDENRNVGYNALQHIAMEVADRDEWLRALVDLKRKGVEIVQGPLIHGPEGWQWPGNAFGGSGSRSFYFLIPMAIGWSSTPI